MLLQKRLFNVTEYHQMVEAGILTERDRVELIIRSMERQIIWHCNQLSSEIGRIESLRSNQGKLL